MSCDIFIFRIKLLQVLTRCAILLASTPSVSQKCALAIETRPLEFVAVLKYALIIFKLSGAMVTDKEYKAIKIIFDMLKMKPLVYRKAT